MPVDSEKQQFSNEHLYRNLRERSLRGGAVTLGSQGLKLLLRLGSTAILARLLVPEDFGMIAMVMAVIGLFILLKDSGLSMATVQWREIEHAEVNALFWLNLGLSMVLLICTFFLPRLSPGFMANPGWWGSPMALPFPSSSRGCRSSMKRCCAGR